MAAPRAAQLAHDRAPRVEVHLLADQRRAPAVRAVPATRLARPDALAKERAFEVRLGEAEERAGMPKAFAARPGSSPRNAAAVTAARRAGTAAARRWSLAR